MQQLLGSLVEKFMLALNALQTCDDDEQRIALINFLNNIMAYSRFDYRLKYICES